MPVAWAVPLRLQKPDCTFANRSAISSPFEESSHSGFTHSMWMLYITVGMATSKWGWIGFFDEYFPLVAQREFLSAFSWTPQLLRGRGWKMFVTPLSPCPLSAHCVSLYFRQIWLKVEGFSFWIKDWISVSARQLALFL